MQATHPADLLHAGTQVKMVGISQQNLDAEFFQNVLRHAFDRRQGSDRHEYWRFHYAVCGKSRPARAAPQYASISKKVDTAGIVAIGVVILWEVAGKHQVTS